jgi:large subunit ribosomal protein L19
MAKTEKTTPAKAKAAKTTKTAGAKSSTPIATNRLEALSSLKLKTEIPSFRSGDKVVVKSKIKESEEDGKVKYRIQAFEGIVIARNGRGIKETFTVRKVSAGVGVERVYPLHSPTIDSIEVKVEGFVRRGKLYYLRDLSGKSARIRDRNLKLLAAQGAEAAAKSE